MPRARGKPNLVSDALEMTSDEKVYICSECQLRFRTDATGFLREVDP